MSHSDSGGGYTHLSRSGHLDGREFVFLLWFWGLNSTRKLHHRPSLTVKVMNI